MRQANNRDEELIKWKFFEKTIFINCAGSNSCVYRKCSWKIYDDTNTKRAGYFNARRWENPHDFSWDERAHIRMDERRMDDELRNQVNFDISSFNRPNEMSKFKI